MEGGWLQVVPAVEGGLGGCIVAEVLQRCRGHGYVREVQVVWSVARVTACVTSQHGDASSICARLWSSMYDACHATFVCAFSDSKQ